MLPGDPHPTQAVSRLPLVRAASAFGTGNRTPYSAPHKPLCDALPDCSNNRRKGPFGPDGEMDSR